MHFHLLPVTAVFLLILTACGGGDATTATTAAAPTGPVPAEVIEIASITQFDSEIAKARAGAVVVADFHAEWCGPCKKLGPELVALAAAHPGRFYVLKVDIDQLPQLAERFQVESIPLLVKFADGKEVARQVGLERDQAKFKAWLGLSTQ